MEALLVIVSFVAFYFYLRHRRLQKALFERNTATPARADWLHPFALFFLTSELNFFPNDARGHITLLLNKRGSLSLEQAMLGQLQIYLRHEQDRDRNPADYGQALQFTTDLLRREFSYRSSHAGMRHFVRGLLLKDGRDTSEEAVEAEFRTLMTFIKETGDPMMPLMGILKDSFNDMFEAQFGKSFDQYNKEIIRNEKQILAPSDAC